MRALALALLGVAPLAAQFSFGIKVGRAITDPLKTQVRAASTYTASSGGSVVGASAELRLPARAGIEFDILRRPLLYRITSASGETRVEGSMWEFPLMVRYRLRSGMVSPFVAAGLAWNRVSLPSLVDKASVTGTPIAGGLEGCFGPFCLTGELRYTRWHGDNFADPAAKLSNRNQVEFLVGLKF